MISAPKSRRHRVLPVCYSQWCPPLPLWDAWASPGVSFFSALLYTSSGLVLLRRIGHNRPLFESAFEKPLFIHPSPAYHTFGSQCGPCFSECDRRTTNIGIGYRPIAVVF